MLETLSAICELARISCTKSGPAVLRWKRFELGVLVVGVVYLCGFCGGFSLGEDTGGLLSEGRGLLES